LRYYLSTAGGEGSRPVVFLQGDQLGKFNVKTWVWTDTTEAKDVDSEDLVKFADGISKFTKTTAIYLARVGVDGTSGRHLARKSLLEFDLMNAALDALKQRHGFEGFHLAGQSGGSLLVSGLAELRHDIGCLVIGSGRIISPELPKSKDPARSPFDPTLSISQLVQNRALRPFVVTDKSDKRVPVAQQVGLVDRLRKAGRQVPQFSLGKPAPRKLICPMRSSKRGFVSSRRFKCSSAWPIIPTARPIAARGSFPSSISIPCVAPACDARGTLASSTGGARIGR